MQEWLGDRRLSNLRVFLRSVPMTGSTGSGRAGISSWLRASSLHRPMGAPGAGLLRRQPQQFSVLPAGVAASCPDRQRSPGRGGSGGGARSLPLCGSSSCHRPEAGWLCREQWLPVTVDSCLPAANVRLCWGGGRAGSQGPERGQGMAWHPRMLEASRVFSPPWALPSSLAFPSVHALSRGSGKFAETPSARVGCPERNF